MLTNHSAAGARHCRWTGQRSNVCVSTTVYQLTLTRWMVRRCCVSTSTALHLRHQQWWWRRFTDDHAVSPCCPLWCIILTQTPTLTLTSTVTLA